MPRKSHRGPARTPRHQLWEPSAAEVRLSGSGRASPEARCQEGAMRQAMAWLSVLGLLGTACGASAAAAVSAAHPSPTDAGPESPVMAQWLPWESLPGGRQYDPRLEEAVRFWGAGIPLREVFAEVRGQTGVEIGFWPPGDDIERVCVTLYLDPERPPALRDLMVQLSWVLDCAFACSGENAEMRYSLVRTSVEPDPIGKLQQEARSIRRQREQQRDQIAREVYREALSRLDQFREALELPPEVVRSRYGSVDDLLVLAKSSPEMRAAVQFLATLPEKELTRTSRSFHLDYHLGEFARACYVFIGDWRHITPEQRALLRAALQPTLERNRQEWNARVPPEHRCPEVVWKDDLPLRVEVQFTDVGGFRFSAEVTDGKSPYYGRLGADGPFLAIVPPSDVGILAGETTIALRRAAGERIAPGEEYWATDAFKMALERREMKWSVEQRITEHEHLSEDTAELLDSLPMPLDLGERHSLWQIQEAIAERTGLHVVSDCLCQLSSTLDQAAEVLYGKADPELTALGALRLSCMGLAGREAFAQPFTGPPPPLAWEWGDAGPLLRFRSAERDLWRAGFLPEDVLVELDQWLAPYLPQMTEALESGREVRVPVDLREMGRLAARLTEPQRRWGGTLTYENPTTAVNAYRSAFRFHVFTSIAGRGALLTQFAVLRQDQWEDLCGEGIRWGMELAPSPGAPADAWAQYAAAEEGDVIRLSAPDPAAEARGEYPDDRPRVRLEVVRRGKVVWWHELSTAIRLWPQEVARLRGKLDMADPPPPAPPSPVVE